MLTSLKRGVLSGALAGLLAGAFGYLLAEPVMDRAVRLEAARQAAAGEHSVETFSRHTQHLGFLGATLAVGVALGVLYGVIHRLLPRDGSLAAGTDLAGTDLARTDATGDSWGRALRLGGAGFFALSLVPFLRYPSNPPGVGDAATIDSRTHLWTVTLVIGLVGVAFAGLIARGLRERGARTSWRQLAVTGVLIATVALTFVLPGDTDPVTAPVDLVWTFRLLSLATLAVLWGTLAAAFGLLTERAARSGERPGDRLRDPVVPG